MLEDVLAEALKTAAGGPEESFVDHACVQRYLRANGGNQEEAAKKLVSTIDWRLEKTPASVECRACLKEPHSHNMRVVAIDSQDRPVIYACFGQSMGRFDPKANVQHMTRTIEDANRIIKKRAQRCGGAAAEAETNVWLFDFQGYDWFKDSSPQTGVLTAQLLNHYPERLGRAVMIDAPMAFRATWTVTKSLMNDVTSSKVAFVCSDDGTLENELAEWATPDLLEWILTEVKENRDPANQNGEKKYWQSCACVQTGHDPRGVQDFIQSPEFGSTLTSRILSRLEASDDNA